MISLVLVIASPAAEPVVLRSQSGQFIVAGLPLGRPTTPSAGTNEVSYLHIDPALVTVMLERIKAGVLQQLQAEDHWRGKIFVTAQPGPYSDRPVVVTATRHPDNWSYQVELPEQVEKKKFLRLVVELLLSEIANRGAQQRASELPPWLAVGLAAELRATTMTELMLEPEKRTLHEQRAHDPLAVARELLRRRPPLTLDQLNLPPAYEVTPDQAELYEACAHVFVRELLHLKNGPESLRAMLVSTADFLNWQTAFLLAFQAQFPRWIDVDKWWSLTVVHWTGRDLASLWPLALSWQKLEETLNTPVQVRTRAKELPLKSGVKLQTILAEWEPARRAVALEGKVNQLQAIRVRVANELVGMVDDYREVLREHANVRDANRSRSSSRRSRLAPADSDQIAATIRRLDELDERRERLRAALEPLLISASTANTNSPRANLPTARRTSSSLPAELRSPDFPGRDNPR